MGPDLLLRATATVGGVLLAGATQAVGLLRRSSDRPLHPRGEWWTGTLRRTGGAVPTGAEWLDASGEDDVLIRFSTAVGLPGWCPDIQGVAIRVPVRGDELGGAHADVLLASTGAGRLTRYVLRPARTGHGSPYTSLLPYRGPHGAIHVGMRGAGSGRYELAHAGVRGEWTVFAELELHDSADASAAEDVMRFDPVLAPPPGLGQYDWAVRLREPAYSAARS